MLTVISCTRIVFLCDRWLWWGSIMLILHIRIIQYWCYLPCSLYQTCLVHDSRSKCDYCVSKCDYCGWHVNTVGDVLLPQERCSYCSFGVDETHIWKKDVLHHISSFIVCDVIKKPIPMGTKVCDYRFIPYKDSINYKLTLGYLAGSTCGKY